MKIAIQANPDRGKEIISLLESLGGENYNNWNGNGKRDFYYIDENNKIRFDYAPKGYKLYTLEEFEKEFPFKVGDRVISTTTNFIGTITKLKESGYYIKYDNGNVAFTPGQNLKLHTKMKEERNITLTLDKAKEWYKKGGELKEIALQAFTEKELTKVDLPKTWEELCENYPVKKGECWLSDGDDILQCSLSQKRTHKNWIPSRKSAEAHLAMIQLEQLRDYWRQGWKPTPEKAVYAIKVCSGKLDVFYYCTREFLSFPTREIAEEFLECFRDLIEKAGDLI